MTAEFSDSHRLNTGTTQYWPVDNRLVKCTTVRLGSIVVLNSRHSCLRSIRRQQQFSLVIHLIRVEDCTGTFHQGCWCFLPDFKLFIFFLHFIFLETLTVWLPLNLLAANFSKSYRLHTRINLVDVHKQSLCMIWRINICKV